VFACLRLTGWAATVESPGPALLDVAQQFSPRVAWAGPNALVADLRGLERLFGDARAIGEELRRSLADRGLQAHIAIAASCTASRLLAEARAGVTVIPAGEEAKALAPLPIDLVQVISERSQAHSDIVRARRRRSRADPTPLPTLRRWGLRTLGDLAGLPPPDLAARLGREGPALQAIARGEDHGPLVPLAPDERFEATLSLEWPIEGLEPLSFVLSRLADPICADLDRRGRAAAAISVELRLVTRDTWVRRQELPTPIKDPRTLRTLVLLDLESHPPPAGIDAVTLRAEPTPARTLQHSLLERARPAPEQISTLVARLTALMGDGRVGAPASLDSHRPDAVRMARFTGEDSGLQASDAGLQATGSGLRATEPALRRLRQPAVATVTVEDGRPVRVHVSRPGLPDGCIETCAGPWRTSGEWWAGTSWDRDEWDVALGGGAVCRLFRDRRKDRWFVEGVYD
jgi:protein ImuB